MSREEEIAKALEEINKIKPFFWRAPPPDNIPTRITMDQIIAAEKQLGKRLPTSYLALLHLQNSGSTRYNGHGDYNFDEIFGIGKGTCTGFSIEDSSSLLASPDFEPDLSDNAVVLDGSGHWWLCLDYRGCKPGDEPIVIHDERESDEVDEDRITIVAPNFMEFLKGLYNHSPFCAYGFVDVDDPTNLINVLSNELKTGWISKLKFKASELGNRQAYTVRHKWKTNSHFPSTIWIAPNKHNLPEPDNRFQTNLEFPEHPECNWILEWSVDKSRQEQIEEKLARVPYQVVTLHIPTY